MTMVKKYSWQQCFLCLLMLLPSRISFQTQMDGAQKQKFSLIASEKFQFNSFVDCNMAEAWIADTFRIFPGKYGEDPLWGYAHDLKFADGENADAAFQRAKSDFREPVMPLNA